MQKQLKTTQIKGVSVEITISIGVAVKENIMTKEEWIAKADKALYLSKIVVETKSLLVNNKKTEIQCLSFCFTDFVYKSNYCKDENIW